MNSWNSRPPCTTQRKSQPLACSLSLSLHLQLQGAMYFSGSITNIGLLFSKFSDGWCWRASCNQNKNHESWSNHNTGYRSAETDPKLWAMQWAAYSHHICHNPIPTTINWTALRCLTEIFLELNSTMLIFLCHLLIGICHWFLRLPACNLMVATLQNPINWISKDPALVSREDTETGTQTHQSFVIIESVQLL